MKTGARGAAISPLLEGLDEAQRSAILARASARVYPRDAVLCRQGEPADSLFVLQEGPVKFARTTGDGREVILLPIVPGDCFGLASLVAGPVNYMGTATSSADASVLVWDGAEIREVARLFPKLSENAFRIALQYIEQIAERHIALLSQSAEQRVARTINHLGATAGHVQPDGVQVHISNHDLAALADVGMYTVSRQLKRWEREGHVIKKRQTVLIRHPEALLSD